MSHTVHSNKDDSLTFSSEQVVPFSELLTDTDQTMDSDLPDEKGAAALNGSSSNPASEKEKSKEEISSSSGVRIGTQRTLYDTNVLEEQRDRSHCSEVYMSEDDLIPMSQTTFSYNRVPVQPWHGQISQIEGDMDMGYSSHSTSSSCQPESQPDSAQALNFTDADGEGFNEDDEMEDLLFHFDRFFKNRYEELLTEQEMHVRQIVSRALKTCGEKCCCSNVVEMTDKSTQTEQDKFTVPSLVLDSLSFNACDKQENSRAVNKFSSEGPGAETYPKERLLLKILTYTCSLTSLLQRTEYKTL